MTERAPPLWATKTGTFTQTATVTARASTDGIKSREFSLKRPRRLNAPPRGATKTVIFHLDGHGVRAHHLHRGQHKQGLFTQTATATARASTKGNKSRDCSLRRPRRLRAPPPWATKAGTFHSDGCGDGAPPPGAAKAGTFHSDGRDYVLYHALPRFEALYSQPREGVCQVVVHAPAGAQRYLLVFHFPAAPLHPCY